MELEGGAVEGIGRVRFGACLAPATVVCHFKHVDPRPEYLHARRIGHRQSHRRRYLNSERVLPLGA